MTDTSGFYKYSGPGDMQFAPNAVNAPDYTLSRGTKDSQTYPVDGWSWFDSDTAAMSYFATQSGAINGVSQSVTRYQALAALYNAGLLDQVKAAVAAAGGLTQIAWDNATTFERSSAFISAMQGALGLTAAQVDGLFVAAAQIT